MNNYNILFIKIMYKIHERTQTIAKPILSKRICIYLYCSFNAVACAAHYNKSFHGR